MPEEKKTTRKTAPKKTTSKKTSKKSEVVEVKEPVEPIVSEEVVTSAENVTSAEKGIFVKIAVVLPEEGLKIRTGPGVNYPKCGKLDAETEVEVLEEMYDFVRIGQDQWVMKSYLGGI